jgi:hypothetical protein
VDVNIVAAVIEPPNDVLVPAIVIELFVSEEVPIFDNVL